MFCFAFCKSWVGTCYVHQANFEFATTPLNLPPEFLDYIMSNVKIVLGAFCMLSKQSANGATYPILNSKHTFKKMTMLGAGVARL